jgi:hypothetical protein
MQSRTEVFASLKIERLSRSLVISSSRHTLDLFNALCRQAVPLSCLLTRAGFASLDYKLWFARNQTAECSSDISHAVAEVA